MTTLTITQAPGGCLPGTLSCDCGHEALCIWTPQLGAGCDKCRTCCVTDRWLEKPGTYEMRPGPWTPALLTPGHERLMVRQ